MRRFEIRLAVRTLAAHPVFSATVVATLAAAFAFNVAAASVLSALLIHPFPYPELSRLVLVRDARPAEGVHSGHAIAAADFLDLRRSVPAFAQLAAFRSAPLVITSPGADPESIQTTAVTANFFTTLGVVPIRGRPWTSDADEPGKDAFVVLSRRLWHSRFGENPAAVGGDVFLNGRRVTVVGIIRDEDCYPAGVDAWVPLVLSPADRTERAAQRLGALARLAADASIASADAQLVAAAARLAATYPLTNQGRGFNLLPLGREQYEFTAPLFGFVEVTALLVLALAVVNVTSLLLARTLDRADELAVRGMLGASRADVARVVLVETMILAAVAAVVGAVTAAPVLGAIRASLPEGISRWVNGWTTMHIDTAAVAAGLTLVAISAAIVGAAASGAAWACVTGASSGSRVTRSRALRRRLFIAGEIALAAALLLCAAVAVQGGRRVADAFAALEPERVLRFELTTPPWRYPDDVRVTAVHERLLESIRTLPGVSAVALIRNEPASNVPSPTVSLDRLDAPSHSIADRPQTDVQVVSPDIFAVLRVNILSGRGLLSTDNRTAARVAVISREAQRRFWSDRDPVGTIVHLGSDPAPTRIVGVVGDWKLNWYDPELRPVIYVPDAQAPARTASVLVRTRVDPLTLGPEVRARMRQLDNLQPIAGLEPLSTTIADSLSPIRVVETLLLAGATVAAALGAIGIFGVLAQAVGQRRREFGIRFAVGARPSEIGRLVLREALAASAVGLIVGLILAVPAVALARTSLLGLAAINVPAILVVVVCTCAVAMAAAFGPARRASRVDIAALLRPE